VLECAFTQAFTPAKFSTPVEKLVEKTKDPRGKPGGYVTAEVEIRPS
jgi:hypothetical protein